MTSIQLILIVIGAINIIMGIANRIANYQNHKEITNILKEGRKKS